MDARRLAFAEFELDITERRLTRGGEVVEVSGRYFDALALLAGEAGSLVTKDRFHETVWRGVPVTDEALTQCIRSLRAALGDKAAAPRFIETVPKHGYRFIAEVAERGEADGSAPSPAPATEIPSTSIPGKLTLAGATGGALAGVIGGLFYGFAGAGDAAQGSGGASMVLVLLAITIALGAIAGGGIGLGIGLGDKLAPNRWWSFVLGGMIGGAIIGALARLIGMDGFALLLGGGPSDMAGGFEGTLFGAICGLFVWLAHPDGGPLNRKPAVIFAATTGFAAGALQPQIGGLLMGGSLQKLAEGFPGSRVDLSGLGRMLGEDSFGPLSATIYTGLEGLVFTGYVVTALLLFWSQREK